MFTINRETQVPLYLQLAQNIEDRIKKGIFKPGAKIPSETELMKNHSVSRITVRQAMNYLSEKDLIIRRRGLGSFVRRVDVRQPVETLFGIYQSLTKIVSGLTMKLREYQEESPTQEVQTNLQIQHNEKVLKFVRLYQVEEEILFAAEVFIPMSIAENWSRDEAEMKESLHLLEENAGIRVASMQVGVRAVKATESMSKYLQISTNNPVLELRRLAFSEEGKPVQYAVAAFHGETYELTTQITSDRFNEQPKIGKYKSAI